MLEKTIKQVLNKKVTNWLESIEDKKIRDIVAKNVIITGGCIPSLMENIEPNDFDVYFKTKEAVLEVARYYANMYNTNSMDGMVSVIDGEQAGIRNTADRIKLVVRSIGIAGDLNAINASEELGVDNIWETIEEIDETKEAEIIEKTTKKYYPVFFSTNAITLSDKIQIVVRFYGEPEKIHETYDFEHTKAYYCYSENKLEIPKKVYECVNNKTLIYTGSLYPVCSVFRLRKFIGRGWKINAGQILKMCMQISELNLQDIATLEDHLVGVDSSYFMNLIQAFAEKKEKDPSWELDSNYIISIIDKIF